MAATARLALVGTLVQQMQTGPVLYEKFPKGAEIPTLPVPHPGHPENRQNRNFSRFCAPDLEALFGADVL